MKKTARKGLIRSILLGMALVVLAIFLLRSTGFGKLSDETIIHVLQYQEMGQLVP